MASSRHRERRPVSPPCRRLLCFLSGLALAVVASSACAAPGNDQQAPGSPPAGEKVHILDGSQVLTAGRLYLNVTNWGLLGSRYSEISSYGDAPSGQWPGGSSDEYIFAAGLWVGGIVAGELRVTTGQPEAELRPSPDPRATIYNAREAEIVDPAGNPGAGGIRFFQAGGDDDRDGTADEEILDGYDQDGDGRVDEDFGQLGTQMLVATMRDDAPLSRALYPDHSPMHLEVAQRAFCWQTAEHQDFVVLSYEISNDGAERISDLYLGLWMDGDVADHGDYSGNRNDLAGTYDGFIRRPEGHYVPVRTAYMWDGAESGALPGWCGITLIGHTVDYDGVKAPDRVLLRAARVISPAGTVGGGAPLSDSDRYILMAEPGTDEAIDPRYTGDYRVMVSAGPFPELLPGDRLTVEFAICMGEGLEAMLETCAAAMNARYALWLDLDDNRWTGNYGREHIIYAEDFYPVWTSPNNPVYARNADIWDRRCAENFLILPNITPDSFTLDPVLRKHYMYVNADICEECSWIAGFDCIENNAGLAQWLCFSPYAPRRVRGACTGTGGRETPIPWTVNNAPPPAPHVRTVEGDARVDLFWDDHSEKVADELTGRVDFESYRVWRSDNWVRPPGSSETTGPARDSWHLLGEYDVVNQYTEWYELDEGTLERTMELGPNTGLSAAGYIPVCLDDPRFAGLSAAMHEVVLSDSAGVFGHRPPLRDPHGVPIPRLAGLLPWEKYPAELDTFFSVIPRPEAPGIVPKPRTFYYHYADSTVTNGFIYFYAVTTTDHTTTSDGSIITGRGVGGAPGAAFVIAHPRQDAVDRDQAAENYAYAYPNPATRESLAEFQALHPNAKDPTGARIAFANLPPVRCEIQIFTLAGDLVQTVTHDGHYEGGQATWNLITRNGQEVVSGIYLFAVVPLEPGHERQIGKFVVIR